MSNHDDLAPDPSMPLKQYLDCALRENNSLFESHTKHEDPYLSPLFNFTRSAKGHPDLRELNAYEAIDIIENEWLSAKGYGNLDQAWERAFVGIEHADDARTEFLDLWDSIRTLPGESLLDAARRLSVSDGLVSRFLPYCPTKISASVMALACALQEMRGSAYILLPCREIGEFLGCSALTISRVRRWALKLGLLTIVNPHRFNRDPYKQEATEFLVNQEKVEALLRSAPPKKQRKQTELGGASRAGRTYPQLTAA